MGYFESIFSEEITGLVENLMGILSDKEDIFPNKFLDVLEEMFGKENIKGLNPNSFYNIENWKEYLIKHKAVIIKIENLEKYLKLILRKKSLIIETTDNYEYDEKYIIRKKCSDSMFRSSIFDLINVATTDFEKTKWFKDYEINTSLNIRKFNKDIFIKNYKNDLNIDIEIEKILIMEHVRVYLLKTPSGNILFDSNGRVLNDIDINKNVLEYTKDYLNQLKDLKIKF